MSKTIKELLSILPVCLEANTFFPLQLQTWLLRDMWLGQESLHSIRLIGIEDSWVKLIWNSLKAMEKNLLFITKFCKICRWTWEARKKTWVNCSIHQGPFPPLAQWLWEPSCLSEHGHVCSFRCFRMCHYVGGLNTAGLPASRPNPTMKWRVFVFTLYIRSPGIMWTFHLLDMNNFRIYPNSIKGYYGICQWKLSMQKCEDIRLIKWYRHWGPTILDWVQWRYICASKKVWKMRVDSNDHFRW